MLALWLLCNAHILRLQADLLLKYQEEGTGVLAVHYPLLLASHFELLSEIFASSSGCAIGSCYSTAVMIFLALALLTRKSLSHCG